MRASRLLTLAMVAIAPAWVACDLDPTPFLNVDVGDMATDTAPDVADTAPDAPDTSDTAADSDVAAPAPHATLAFDLTKLGPHQAGYRILEVTYTEAATAAERTVPLHIWYPTDAPTKETAIYGGLFDDPESFVGAPAAAPDDAAGYPVVVFSHGHLALGGSGAHMHRWMASHGWVTVSPVHVGDTLDDGSLAATLQHYIQRPSDITAALDALEALPESEPLSAANTKKVLLSGHSRGSYSVWAGAGAAYSIPRISADWTDASPAALSVFSEGLGDSRVAAAAPMAGAYRPQWFGDSGYTAVKVPVMVFSGGDDNHASMAAQWDALTNLSWSWVELAGGCHETFGLDFCNGLAPSVSRPIIGAYLLAFARAHVLGDTDATTLGIIGGSIPVDADAKVVTIKTRIL